MVDGERPRKRPAVEIQVTWQSRHRGDNHSIAPRKETHQEATYWTDGYCTEDHSPMQSFSCQKYRYRADTLGHEVDGKAELQRQEASHLLTRKELRRIRDF